MLVHRSHRPQRRGSLTTWLLLSLPVLVVFVVLGTNIQLVNFWVTAQERVTDASALAGAQVMVDDTMLNGTATNITNLEDLAKTAAQQYATFNPVNATPVTYADSDFVFTTIPNPLNPSLNLVQQIQVTGQRTTANNSAYPLLWGRALGLAAQNVITRARATFDRNVIGFHPVYQRTIPLAPIAFLQSDWQANVDMKFTPPPLPTYTVTLQGAGSAKANFLNIGIATDSDLATQLTNGITSAQLKSFGGELVLAPNSVAVPTFTVATTTDLDAALLTLQTNQTKRAWPLFSSLDGSGNAVVVGFVAARLISFSDDGTNLTLTLQPTFMTDVSVLTNATQMQTVNPYLARVHLTK